MSEPQVIQPIKELILPRPHMMQRLVRANETYFVAGRGTGKTSRGIALYIIDMVYEMPRSSGACVGLSFEHLGDNTMPPLLHALEEFGLEHGVHYVVGQRPPKDWPRPYLGMINDKWDHTMAWHNGTVMHLVSLKKKASANGISVQWGPFDECKFMDEKTLSDEIFPIFRGNEQYFKFSSGYLSKYFATDKLADPVRIKWILNKKKQNNDELICVVITLQHQLSLLKKEYSDAGINKKQRMKPQIHAIETRLAKLRSKMVYYVEAGAMDMVGIHGEKWLADKKRNMGTHEYKVAILNEDPDRPGESFYPDFSILKHTHRIDHDINPGKPLIIAADYQHSIAPIVVAQLTKLPGENEISLNYVDEVYTLANPDDQPMDNGNGQEGGLQEAVQLFCDRYKNHLCRTVYFVYDHTAVGKRVNADAYYILVQKILKRNKFNVRNIYTGKAPSHFQKYQDTREWLTGKEPGAPAININAKRCPKLITSINGSGVKSKNGQTEKDKSGEQETGLDQSETTHFSDDFDMMNHAVIKLKKIKTTVFAGAAVVK
jgi:hypothetical protein